MWESTNFVEQIEITVFPIIFVPVQSVGALLNIWYCIGKWIPGGQLAVVCHVQFPIIALHSPKESSIIGCSGSFLSGMN